MRSSAEQCSGTSDLSAIMGRVFNIQRFSLHDGPGIRTVVFLKGCQMKCVWCANPEGIDCGEVNRLTGESTLQSVAQVYQKVIADEIYYRTSGGGLTLSGGEMALQSRFARGLLTLCRQEGLHTAVETAGFAPWTAVAEACQMTNLVLYDLKLADAERHLRYTGTSIKPILQNLQRLLEVNIPLRIRIPVIPEVNDTPEQAEKMMSLIHALTHNCSSFTGIDLLPYHAFGKGKYTRLGQTYIYAEMHPHAKKADLCVMEQAADRHQLSVNVLSHCIA
ncbi:glycyl radical-activating protein [Enterobacter sp. 10-1]|uniref:glycyl-radical enzyme activating protein n=1 Tax=Raoultella sp. 10-1 TaxID=2683201 RepID=UPI000BA3DEA8|nr:MULTISPECIES: glycyl-radical enzyme activating protein [Enterobacteriaceae]MVT05849.1 glycyl-radical enzyme activating protein [Raoultella sp. 10-1]PAC07695.1 glycyl radical-activating protein [Enterobacter sp. 10-1]